MSNKMSLVTQCGVAVLLMTSLVGAAPYSKYGRTCRDIGCLSSEVCVMTEDPCTTYSRNDCGRYPTCKKNTESGALTCATLICPTGQYCRTENGRPTCVNTVPGLGYDSAGVSTVNGQPSQTNVHRDDVHPVSSNANPSYPRDPYANANAPPAPIPNPSDRNPVYNSGNNFGYPAYPTNTGTNSGSSNSGYPPYPPNTGSNSGSSNSGYPPYPSNTGSISGSSNSGYPPYPSNSGSSAGGGLPYPINPNQNRMPIPGQIYPQSGYPGQSYPSYPQQNQAGYPGYTQQNANYPRQNNGYQNTPQSAHKGYNNNVYHGKSGYRNNASYLSVSPISLIIFSSAVLMKQFFFL